MNDHININIPINEHNLINLFNKKKFLKLWIFQHLFRKCVLRDSLKPPSASPML